MNDTSNSPSWLDILKGYAIGESRISLQKQATSASNPTPRTITAGNVASSGFALTGATVAIIVAALLVGVILLKRK